MSEPSQLAKELAAVEAAERQERIAELEAKLSRPSGVGVLPPLAALACAVCVALLWGERAELEYALSPQEPIELGAEGDYRFDAALNNRYVRIHGIPTSFGTYWQERAATFVAVGLRDTPLLVARVLLPSEAWKPGDKAQRPDQRPFTVRGRLLSRASAQKYEDAFAKHEAHGELSPKWLLVAEARPGGDLGTSVWLGGLFAVAALNAWFFARGVVAYLRRRQAAAQPPPST